MTIRPVNIFATAVISLESLKQCKFSIPTYQRPYVWGNEQVEKLLSDLSRSFQSDNNGHYYIGTIITKQSKGCEDLIDGQQRFTTLWLIAFVFKNLNIPTQLIHFLEVDNELRINFEIRKEVQIYLNQLLGKANKNNTIRISDAQIKELPYLHNIASGLVTIRGIINQLRDKIDIVAFGNYIYTNVLMVKNNAPEHTDLNKLFSTINSAGLQLEQSDIVKSNLLKHLGTDKVIFGKIWEVCENMNNFFERNARAVFVETNWHDLDLSNYIPFDASKFKYKTDKVAIGKENYSTISSILNDNFNIYEGNNNSSIDESVRESEEIYCRSIINFGQLLLHTYRIHLKKENLPDFEGTFHVNRLIEIFKTMEKRSNSAEIKRFFYLLWDIRFAFDKYVIKWITDLDSKTEHLELVNINRNAEAYYTRSEYSKSNMLMLQSILYFTGDYLRQFWLTPFLNFVMINKDFDATGDFVLSFLEEVDNQMSQCRSMNDKDASFLLMTSNLTTDFNIESYLKENKGTSYQHYWFQKLEYLLWKNWVDRNDPKFKSFRITSKNSVEHIFPQNPEFKFKLEDGHLHNFGNLVLLSVSQNSEYSSKDVNVKREEFRNKNGYDSLKSFYIFESYDNEWGKEEIDIHRDKMIYYLQKHYNITI